MASVDQTNFREGGTRWEQRETPYDRTWSGRVLLRGGSGSYTNLAGGRAFWWWNSVEPGAMARRRTRTLARTSTRSDRGGSVLMGEGRSGLRPVLCAQGERHPPYVLEHRPGAGESTGDHLARWLRALL